MKWLSALRRAALVAALFVSGGANAQTYPGTQQPWFLTSDITVFVDGSAGNDSNSGMAAGAGNAWATFAPAYNFFCNRAHGNGHLGTIQVANAASIAGAGGIGGQFALTCSPTGYKSLTLNLGAGTLSGASGFDTVFLANNMQGAGNGFPALHVVNGTLTCSGGGNALHVASGFAIISNTGGALTFGTCTSGVHVFADGAPARIFLNGGYTFSGNALSHVQQFAGGIIDYAATATITCTGSPAFTQFAGSTTGPGSVFVDSTKVTFSGCGTATGARYVATNNGAIITNGGGPTYLPGSTAGVVTTGGRYDSPGTPSVTGCGTTPGAPVGTDQSGHVTEGTTATGCTVNFTTANIPNACTVSISNATAQAGLVILTLNAAVLTVTHPSVSGAVFYWNCPSQ